MVIDGKKIASEIKAELKEYVQCNNVQKKLVVIQVGNDPASTTYVKNKERACEEIGIKFEKIHFYFPDQVSQTILLEYIKRLNEDKNVDGILVQLPLPSHIDEKIILNAIAPEKDVDGFHPINVGKLSIGENSCVPCTPLGIIELLKRSNIEIDGKECVIVGRSNIVGKPIAQLMLANNATVTITHSHTHNLKEVCKRADILIVAIGKAKFITREYVKDGAVVIDVGINRDENNKLCGDVDFNDVKDVASAITPVPGGVGAMTVAMLMKNVIMSGNTYGKNY